MIRPISYAEILDAPNAKELLAEYAAECSLPEMGEAVPQRELYELLEKSGGFQAFGVYDGERLIGFATVLIHPLPHYEGRLLGSTESVFIAKENRNGSSWISLKAHILSYARDRGCVAFSFIAPAGSSFDKVLEHDDGSRHTNNVYLRKLS